MKILRLSLLFLISFSINIWNFPVASAQVFTVQGLEYSRNLVAIGREISDYKISIDRIVNESLTLNNCLVSSSRTIEKIKTCYGSLIRLSGFASEENRHLENIKIQLKNLWGANDSDLIKEQIKILDSQSKILILVRQKADQLSRTAHDALVKSYVNLVQGSNQRGYVEAQNKQICQRFSDRSVQAIADSNLNYELGLEKMDLYEMVTAVRTVEAMAIEATEIERLCSNHYHDTLTSLITARQTLYSKISKINQAYVIAQECLTVSKNLIPLVANPCLAKSGNLSFIYWLHSLRNSR